jgi:hypothetical protein
MDTIGIARNAMMYQAAVGLYSAGRQISKQNLCEVTGVRMSIVDEHVDKLRKAGKLRRIVAGVLELVHSFPPDRPISRTTLDTGLVKLEIGDEYIEITPGEAGKLGLKFHGDAMMYAMVQKERVVYDMVARTERELRAANKRLDAMTITVAKMQAHAKGKAYVPAKPQARLQVKPIVRLAKG